MRRRDFLTRNMQAAAVLTSASTFSIGGVAHAKSSDPWSQAFAQELKTKPWLLGYRSAAQENYAAQATLSGRWPKALSGTLYRNGPAQHEVAGFRYRHWFAGNGMLQAFRLNDGKVQHQGRLIQTQKVKEETAAGRALYPGFASTPPNPAPVTSPDSINVANISVLPHHNKLYALWEAGSPYEINPDTLETIGIHSFSEETSGVPFSAHPRVEPDGTLWNFGYASDAGLIVFWHIDAQGKLQKAGTVASDPMTMPHDFVATKNHLVLLMPPFHYQSGNNESFIDSHKWNPQDPTRILVVRKDDFSKTRWFELPAQWVFHFGNAWEDNAGVIRFDGARSETPEVMTDTFREVMRGRVASNPPSAHHQYQLDTKKGVAREMPMLAMGIDSEFPCINPDFSTQRNQFLYFLSAKATEPAPYPSLTSVSRFDIEKGKLTSYRYPNTKIPEEHIFVPKPNARSEGQGWLIGTALDYVNEKTELNLFDAEAVDAGPIATAVLPYALPLGLHGKFVPL